METRVLIPSSLIIKVISPTREVDTPSIDPEHEEPTSSSSPLIKVKHENEEDSSSNSTLSISSSTCPESEDSEIDSGENEIGTTFPKRKSSKDNKDKKATKPSSNKYNEIIKVSVCAKKDILPGTKFGANEGEIQVIHSLPNEALTPLQAHDMRLVFGCVDKVIDNHIRVCNWLRFLPQGEGGQYNIIGQFVQGQVEFQVTEHVTEGGELVALFDLRSLSQLNTTNNNNKGVDKPLDLSGNAIQHQQQQKQAFFSISSVLGKVDSPPLVGRPILRTRGRERSLLPCEVCGKAFDRPSLLKRHMRTHSGEKPYICDVCSKGFSTSSSLNTHRRIHSGEKPHQCLTCGKRFTASSNLYYHRMTHNKEKPHKCFCGKSFPTPGDLKSHQYVHSGSWPYNCSICHRGFSKQTNLRNHLLLHSGDKPYSCQICHKKFALACNLRAHLRTHEEESNQQNPNSNPVSTCLSCKRSFLSNLNMLVDGYCRPCLVLRDHHQKSASSEHSNKLPILFPSPLKITQSPTLNPLNFFSHSGPHYASPGMIPNPFLEQLFLQWNYNRFAKETAGSITLMQQKLLESQMLAAQITAAATSTSTVPGFSITDLLKGTGGSGSGNGGSEGVARRTDLAFPHLQIDLNLNKFMQQ